MATPKPPPTTPKPAPKPQPKPKPNPSTRARPRIIATPITPPSNAGNPAQPSSHSSFIGRLNHWWRGECGLISSVPFATTNIILLCFTLFLNWNLAKNQTDIVRIEEHSLLFDRYQRGADMLGRDTLATRLWGVNTLEQVARENAAEYHIPIMRLLSAFIRRPPDSPTNIRLPDVEAAAIAIGRRDQRGRVLERQDDIVLDLTGAKLSETQLIGSDFAGIVLVAADLARANLRDTRLSQANLEGANLTSTQLYSADLRGSWLYQADLTDARLNGATLIDARLDEADLSAADLTGAVGLTQGMLALATATRTPPNLSNTVCVDTGAACVWQGAR